MQAWSFRTISGADPAADPRLTRTPSNEENTLTAVPPSGVRPAASAIGTAEQPRLESAVTSDHSRRCGALSLERDPVFSPGTGPFRPRVPRSSAPVRIFMSRRGFSQHPGRSVVDWGRGRRCGPPRPRETHAGARPMKTTHSAGSRGNRTTDRPRGTIFERVRVRTAEDGTTAGRRRHSTSGRPRVRTAIRHDDRRECDRMTGRQGGRAGNVEAG
jgi:hypothetical protein